MTKSGTHSEVEIKLRVADAAVGRRLLRRAGFRVSRRRIFESNLVLDTSESLLLGRGELLRLRRAGRGGVLTFKGVAQTGRHKVRPEIEVAISDIHTMEKVLEHIGYRTVFRYDKFRTEFRPPDGRGLAMLDETPIGTFVELEGPAAWIDRYAAVLGFDGGAYITQSYGSLFREHCEKRRRPPANMVFPTQYGPQKGTSTKGKD